jgi:hypothetical protein
MPEYCFIHQHISPFTSTPFSTIHVQLQRPVATPNVPGVSETCLTDLKTILGVKYYSFVDAWKNLKSVVGDRFTMPNGLPQPPGPTSIRPSHFTRRLTFLQLLNSAVDSFCLATQEISRSQWLLGLRSKSATARLLRLWVRSHRDVDICLLWVLCVVR